MIKVEQIMNMESKLATVIWVLLGTSLIPTLQIISLSLACIVSISAIFIGWPKIDKRIKEIKENWKHKKH